MWSDDQPEPLDLEPFLVIQLEARWLHDPETTTFRRAAKDGTEPELFDPSDDLPTGTRIEPMIPELEGRATSEESLSEWELALARYLHVFPGKGADLNKLLEIVKTWPCVEGAHLPPRVALP